MAGKKSTRKFKTEVSELLDLIIHSLYSNKEIFLRELISNSSDAIDKLKFKAQTNPELTGDDNEFKIEIIPDATAGTLEVRDNGIGMTFDEVVENIGTIARSGSSEFYDAIKQAKESGVLAPELIGQFGVGFYSAFMVADKITVVTRAAGSESGVKWESDGTGSYTVEETEREERGTSVILHLRAPEEDEPTYTNEWTLRETVKRHSDFVSYPVVMEVERQEPVLDDEGKPKEGQTETVVKADVLNSMKAIWARHKSEVEEEEYNDFYKHVAHDWTNPLSRLHLKLEGGTEFDALIYIPTTRPMDLFMPDRKHGIQLYSRRVFIMNDCKELVPDYLRFLKGVVDSADLNLNVSREILQEDRIVRAIRKSLTRKVLDHLAGLSEEDYATFYKEFGIVLKEGIHTDPEQRERISKLLRYPTTKSGDGNISLDQYVANMKEDQEHIYFITGDNAQSLADNPHLEKLKSLDYEIILMSEPIDEFVTDAMGEFGGKKFKSAEKGDLTLGDEDKEDAEKENSELVEFFKESLKDNVKDVRISKRLTDSAACLSGSDGDMSAMMMKMLKASGQGFGDDKRVLEINPDHPFVQAIDKLRAEGGDNAELGRYAKVLLDLACIGEGAKLENPATFAKSMAELAAKAIGS